MPNSVELPSNIGLAHKVLDNQKESEQRKDEMGFLGRVWGASSAVPNNIAAFVILLSLIAMVILPLVIKDVSLCKYLWSGLTSLITLSLGYVFGYKKAGHENK